MIEVHVVSDENRSLYEDLLDDYFRQRFHVFVEEKGWKALRRDDRLEKDEFDDSAAVYVIATDREGVIGGHRFHPTTSPYMLDSVFAYLAQWPIPTGDDVWEATRYFVRRSRRAGITDALMMVATYQFCIEEGVSQVVGILETSTLSRRIQAGLKLRPLGLPQEVDGESVVAVVADMTDAGFATMLKRLHAKPLAMVRRGIKIGSIQDRVHARRVGHGSV